MRAEWLTKECLDAAEGRGPKTQTIPVFRNRFLDRWLARAHPAFPVLLFGPVALASLFVATRSVGVLHAIGLALLGWLGFSLFEYLLHRFAFHRTFPDTPQGRLEAFMVHGYHHAYPRDEARLVMPPMISLPLGTLIAASYVVAMGRGAGLAAFAGTLLGYIAYDEVHYLLHHARPRTAIGKWLRRYHFLHHHTHEPSRFGVSSPLWDWVFGTLGRPKTRSVRATR